MTDRTRRTVLFGVLLVIASVLLIAPTSSVLIDGGSDIHEDLSLQSHDGPNGAYSYVDEDDELVIDLSATNSDVEGDGVNADAVTEIDDIFMIRYNGSGYARLWISHHHRSVTFVVDGTSLENPANNVTLGPNQSVAVGVRIDTTRDVSRSGIISEDDFQINAAIAEPTESDDADSTTPQTSLTRVTAPTANQRRITISNANAGERKVIDLDRMQAGANVTLDRVHITHAKNGDVQVHARGSDEPPSGDTDVTVATGANALGYVQVAHDHSNAEFQSVHHYFTVDRDVLKTRNADPEDIVVYRHDGTEYTKLNTEVVAVHEEVIQIRAISSGYSVFAVAIPGSQFEVSNRTLINESVAPGDVVTVTATVENAGDAAGSTELTLLANDEPVAFKAVHVAPGDSRTVTFEVIFEEPGQYALAVDEKSVGTLVVESTGIPGEVTETQTKSDRGVSFVAGALDKIGLEEVLGLILVLLLLLALQWLIRRVPRA